MPRKLHAILFELTDEAGIVRLLTAWPDHTGNGPYLVPAHPDRTLLTVTAGDVLIHNRQDRYVIRRLKPYRTSECRDDKVHTEIRSGEDWENGN